MNYEIIKEAVLLSNNINELKQTKNMPPVPLCEEDQNFVFISYSHHDYKSVYCDLLELHKAGLRYWYDQGLPAGKDWDDVVANKIKSPMCAGVIFYISEHLFISSSVIKEIQYTLNSSEIDKSGKNYFCINLSGNAPSKILFSAMKKSNIDSEHISELMKAFSDKSTYIAKSSEGDNGHITETIENIKNNFNVISEDCPIDDNEELIKLRKELKVNKDFLIDNNGVLTRYQGNDAEVIIPDTVSEINNYAFLDCSDIESVVIQKGVNKIGDQAFFNCRNLKKCSIPDTVTYIGKEAFSLSPVQFTLNDSGEYLYVGEGDVQYIDNWAVFCNRITENKQYHVVLRNGTVGVIKDALNKPQITEITLPIGMKKIYQSTFNGYTSLRKINIPNSVTYIGNNAFNFCKTLSNITVPGNVDYIDDFAFAECNSLKNVTIPPQIVSINTGVFSGCSSLKRIKISGKIDTIADFAFAECFSLKKFSIPDSVTSIGTGAFSGCRSIKKIIIPEGVTIIDSGTFRDCYKLKTITIPKSVKVMHFRCLSGCRSLKYIKYLGTKAEWNAITKLTSIDEEDFSWDKDTNNYVVKCIDGDVSKD